LPAVAGPKEVYGFSRDMGYYFQSERDLWMYDFNTDSLSCLSKFEGASRNIVLSLRKKQSDSMFVDIENSYVQGFNKTTKGLHVFGFTPHKDHYDLIENLASPHRLVGLSWSDDGESVLLRRSRVDQYPDVYLGDAKMNGLNRISDINPQQADLKWSSLDLVSWMSYDSVQLEGLVIFRRITIPPRPIRCLCIIMSSIRITYIVIVPQDLQQVSLTRWSVPLTII
jgi:hypothetical protein